MNHKFRASFTVLNIWASGDWERAIKAYFKLEKFVTPAMAEGRDWHKKWAEESKLTKKLPAIFGGQDLVNPIIEEKRVVSIEPWLDLVFIIDNYDKPVLHEYKTGKQSSEAYASSMQLPVYAVGATLSGLYVEQGKIYHYDQYSKKVDMSVVWITDKLLKDAHNWIVTLGGEMHDYFIKNGLYERFGSNLNKANAETIIE